MIDKQDVIVSLLKGIDKNIDNLGRSETDVLLSNRITTLENSVKTINTAINGIESTNTTQTANITSNTTNINTANLNITDLTNELSTVKSNVSTNTSNIGTLTTDVNTLKTTSATKTELNTTNTSLNTTNTNVSNLTTRVTDVENKATTNESNLNTLNERVTTLENAEPSDEGGGSPALVPITHSELVTLRNESKLIPGQLYRITDYVATTTDPESRSANHPFDIIVTADSENVLNENARAIQHEGDTYFADCKLEAWELKYCLDNDTNKYAWADDSTNGKGVIYWLKDEWNNECSYDFKNIQFKRVAISNIEATGITSDMLSELQTVFVYENNGGICYGQVNGVPSNVSNNGSTINYTFDNSIEKYYYTFTWVDENNVVQDASIVGQQLTNDEGQYSGVFNNQIQPVSQYMFYPESPNSFGYSLNNIVFVSTYSFEGGLFYGYYGNKFGVNCYNNTFGNNCGSNTFGNSCYSNTFGESCYNNTFGESCYSNTFGNDCYQNTFGNGCYGNTFGNSCESNTFGNNCWGNTFGNSCGNNTIGNYCGNNTIGNSCGNNTIGNYCYNNTFVNNCGSNTFGNSCYYNTFGNYCYYNTFGNDCYYNTFGNDCYGNTFGNSCESNTFGNGYIKECRFGDGVRYCTISGYEDLGNYGNDYYIRNIVVLNGTKGSYSQLLELNENQIFNTHNFKQDSDSVPQIVCGFFVNKNDVMTYIAKYYFDAALVNT